MQRKQHGVTFVELLVALTLGLLLLGGIMQVYLGTKTTYQVSEGLSRLQENTRFSIDMMARDIRMAGYLPCSQPQTSKNVLNASSGDWWRPVFNGGIQGFEAGVSTFPDAISDVADGNDAILIRRAGKEVAAVNFLDTTSNQFIMQTDFGDQWNDHQGNLFVACDPNHAALFQAGAVSTSGPTTKISIGATSGSLSPGNSSMDLERAFGNDAQIATYSPVIYYISESVSGDGNSLFREYTYVVTDNTIKTEREEMLQGVENMQILYGLDEDGDGVANRYVRADIVQGANAWSDVVTVRVGLLFASEDGVRDIDDLDDNTYLVANTVIDPDDDRRKRYVSSMTVNVRNSNI
ncbi:MAG: PilW family protein [Pseudomonadota bacterium]